MNHCQNVNQLNEIADKIDIMIANLKLAQINNNEEEIFLFTNKLEILLNQYMTLRHKQRSA